MTPRTRETPLDARLAEVRQRIRFYAGGDRPPSPPAYLLAEERAFEEGVAACREATRLPCGHSIDDLAKPAVGATVCRACLVAGEPLAPALEVELLAAREHLVERDDQIASLRRRLAAQNADTIARALGEAMTAELSTELSARPFVKWVGGKRQLLSELAPRVPVEYGAYYEPFVGGGALFFHLLPEHAVLSDTNERLVRAYLGVRDAVDEVIALLQGYPHDRDFFLKMRGIDIDRRTDAEVAAWLIYLNRTGYNGLYRVNRRNVYNVPFGDYTNPTICDEENLRACARALRRADIRCESFESVTRRARPGDFVYFDPPYVPLSASSSFTSYTSAGFGMEDQARLRDVARTLTARGVRVLLSNSSAPAVFELYRDGFELVTVGANRAVSCRGTGRGRVQELIITTRARRLSEVET